MNLLRRITNYLNPNTSEYWDNIYLSEIGNSRVRQDQTILKLLPILYERKNIFDFGCGVGGNVKLLSEYLHNKNFYLLDHSVKAIEFAKNIYLKTQDDKGNYYYYYTKFEELPDNVRVDAILSIEVLEHIGKYSEIVDELWNLLEDDGILIFSVPVKGWRDRHQEHINKFTIKSMFEFLTKYSDWVHISPRTYSRRSGILATAFFYVIKSKR